MFSEKLKKLRTNKGLTQAQLAEKMSLTQQAIAKWERGLAEPDIAALNKLLIILNCNPNYLLRQHRQPFVTIGNSIRQRLCYH